MAENEVDPLTSETVHGGLGKNRTPFDREPDVGEARYRHVSQDGPMVFRQQFLRSGVEPPADNIRRALTQIEFEGEMGEPGASERVENLLQKIEGEIDRIRLAIRKTEDGN